MKKAIKAICVVLGAAFLISVAGCSKKPDETKISETGSEVQTTASSETAADTSEVPSSGLDEDFKDYTKVSNLELFTAYMNYNKKYRENQFSHGNYYEERGSDQVCFPVLVRYDEEVFGKPFDGELDDIFDIYNNGDFFMAASRCSGNGVPYNMNDEVVLIETDSSEKVNINGIDTIHFTGHASYNKSGDELQNFYVTGYTFIFNEQPYMLAGIIFDEKAGDDLRPEMDKEIDIMMKTVRSEREKEGIPVD